MKWIPSRKKVFKITKRLLLVITYIVNTFQRSCECPNNTVLIDAKIIRCTSTCVVIHSSTSPGEGASCCTYQYHLFTPDTMHSIVAFSKPLITWTQTRSTTMANDTGIQLTLLPCGLVIHEVVPWNVMAGAHHTNLPAVRTITQQETRKTQWVTSCFLR